MAAEFQGACTVHEAGRELKDPFAYALHIDDKRLKSLKLKPAPVKCFLLWSCCGMESLYSNRTPTETGLYLDWCLPLTSGSVQSTFQDQYH